MGMSIQKINFSLSSCKTVKQASCFQNTIVGQAQDGHRQELEEIKGLLLPNTFEIQQSKFYQVSRPKKNNLGSVLQPLGSSCLASASASALCSWYHSLFWKSSTRFQLGRHQFIFCLYDLGSLLFCTVTVPFSPSFQCFCWSKFLENLVVSYVCQ